MPICKRCKPLRSAAVMTEAECGHETTRAGMKLCPGCAKTQDACEACGEPIDAPVPPED